MLRITGIKHSYNSNSSKIDIVYPDWKVDQGDHSVILGNSGCGKTTLLHMIGGLMMPKEGIIEVSDKILCDLSSSKMDRFRGKNIGIIFQKPHLIQSLSIKENVMLAQYLVRKKTEGNIAEEVLAQLGIKNLSNRKIYQISQGQAQRVSIARAVINSPKLLLADEPTANLDDENCQKVINLLKLQSDKTGATLIVATHDHRVKNEFQNRLFL